MKKTAFILGLIVFTSCGRGGSSNFELDAAYRVFGVDFPLEPPIDYSSNAPNDIHRDNRIGRASVKLELTYLERDDLEAFIKTLTGSNLYTDVS